MDHVALIRRHYDDLTGNQKRLADCIISSPNAAFLTTTDLAKLADVSQSTVVRFAQTLGYQGYPQLQNDLQKHLIGKLTPSARLKRLRSENIGDLGTRILDTDIGHLESINTDILILNRFQLKDFISHLVGNPGTIWSSGVWRSSSYFSLSSGNTVSISTSRIW